MFACQGLVGWTIRLVGGRFGFRENPKARGAMDGWTSLCNAMQTIATSLYLEMYQCVGVWSTIVMWQGNLGEIDKRYWRGQTVQSESYVKLHSIGPLAC